MPRKNPPARWVLPEVIDPPDSICVTIPVPNDRQHIAAFWGAILNLASGINWADDPDHKARLVAHVWRDIFDALKPDSCDIPEIPLTIEEWEDILSICESLRFHNGKLQGLCCGDWTDIGGQDGLDIGGPDQQGDGAEQPDPNGGCQLYHAKFNANTTYLLPVLVNAGDTLEFTNADGAGHDGSFLATWRCPDGGTFFGGKCLGIYASDGADPNPAIPHIALIAEIDGVFYPAYSGTVTVPGGVVNAQVILQANDATIGDNGGSYSVDVTVCNNTLTTYSHKFDFTAGPQGWVGIATLSGGWVGGKFVGLHTVTAEENRIEISVPAGVSITSIGCSVNTDHADYGIEIKQADATHVRTDIYNQALASGSTANRNYDLPQQACTMLPTTRFIQVYNTGQFSTSTYTDTLSVTFEGLGPDPFA